jgi:hypothetical protein
VNDTIASSHIGRDDLRHVTTRVASSLLKDIAVAMADGATIIPTRHVDDMSALQILGKDNMILDGMKQQNVLQEGWIRQDCFQKSRIQFRKRVICGSENRPGSSTQGTPQTGRTDRSAKS